MREIILASASPRRKELLEQMGMEFLIKPAVGEEVITTTIPSEAVKELSQQKAMEIAEQTENHAIVIGADTVVAFGTEIMGKPKDEEDAFRMLHLLQGNTHSVYTGVTLIDTQSDKKLTFVEETKVMMYPMSEEMIWDYIHTKEPMDKAGAYAIQGSFAVYIKEIHGEYNTVVGLPIARLYQELSKFS